MNVNGYVVAHSDVNDKFRNLMATYRYENFCILLGFVFNLSFLNLSTFDFKIIRTIYSTCKN